MIKRHNKEKNNKMAEVFLVSYFHVNGLKASIKRLKLGKKA